MSIDEKGSQILVIPATSAHDRVTQAERIINLIIDDGTTIPQEHSSTNGVQWHISNRYYEANVHFKISQSDLSTAGSSKKKPFESRKARIRSEVEIENNADNDSQLDQKARDVFAALEMGPPSSIKNTNNTFLNGKEKASNIDFSSLRQEVKDVQAVILIVDHDQSFSEHKKLLNALNREIDGENLLSGFDLAVSLIVGLPSPLNDASTPTNLTIGSNSEEVEDLYAGEGWEYVDLAKIERYIESDAEDEAEGENAPDTFFKGDEDEKYGIERVREALMTHAWPGLERKQDRRQGLSSTSEDVQIDESLTQTLTSLRLNLDAIDNQAGIAQPTEKDEELARAFMARIQTAQEAGLGSLKDEDDFMKTGKPSKSITDMQSALESFLESTDPESFAKPNSVEDMRADEAWDVKGAQTEAIDHAEAFDDDFTEFIEANPTNMQNSRLSDPTSISFQDFLDDNDLAFIGDADDALLMQALAERQRDQNTTIKQRSNVDSSDIHIDFEATLQAVLAHAERIRAIPDDDQRREEAARIALALTDQ